MNLEIRKNQKGISIVEVLVATGIMAILMTGFSSFMLSQSRETRAVAEILSAQDLMKSLIGSLAKGDVCQHILSTQPFNATQVIAGTPYVIDIGNQPIYSSMATAAIPGPALIKKGDKASAYTSSLEVESIQFEVTTGTIVGTVGNFKGRWIIKFDDSKTIRKMKPLSISAVISANTTTPLAARTVSCLGSGGSIGSGTANYIAKWSTDNEIMESMIFEDKINNRIGIGTATPTSKLDINGDIKIGSSAVACAASTEGQLRYDVTAKNMQFCNGTAWAAMGGSGGASKMVTCSYVSSHGAGCGQPAIQPVCNTNCGAGYTASSTTNSSDYITNMGAGICAPEAYTVTRRNTLCNAN